MLHPVPATSAVLPALFYLAFFRLRGQIAGFKAILRKLPADGTAKAARPQRPAQRPFARPRGRLPKMCALSGARFGEQTNKEEQNTQ
jgi:hypothetical protein